MKTLFFIIIIFCSHHIKQLNIYWSFALLQPVEEDIGTIFSWELPLELLIFWYIELGNFVVIEESPPVLINSGIVEIVPSMNTDSLVNNEAHKLIGLNISFDGVITKNFLYFCLGCFEPVDVQD